MIGVKGELHGTEVDFDSLVISEGLREELLSMVDVIASLSGAELFRKLDELFSRDEIQKIVESVKAVGAGEKAKVVKNYCESKGIDFPVVVGDSISDYKMFEAARDAGGVAIASTAMSTR